LEHKNYICVHVSDVTNHNVFAVFTVLKMRIKVDDSQSLLPKSKHIHNRYCFKSQRRILGCCKLHNFKSGDGKSPCDGLGGEPWRSQDTSWWGMQAWQTKHTKCLRLLPVGICPLEKHQICVLNCVLSWSWLYKYNKKTNTRPGNHETTCSVSCWQIVVYYRRVPFLRNMPTRSSIWTLESRNSR